MIAPLRRVAVSVVLVGLMLAALLVARPGAPGVIDGAERIMAGRLCDTPEPGAPCAGARTDLPVLVPDTAPQRIRFDLPEPAATGAPPGPKALYFPKFSDGLDVYVNGHHLLSTALPGGPYWHWNRPGHVALPESLLSGADRIELVLHAAPPFQAALSPFYIGAAQVLYDAYRTRMLLTRDTALFGLVLTLMCTLGLLAVAVLRWRDKVYHWAALAGASAAVISLHYATASAPLPTVMWQVVWTVSVASLVAALHRFVRRFLRRCHDPAETVALVFAAASVVVMTALGLFAPQLVLIGSALTHAAVLTLTLYLLADFMRDRRFTTQLRFLTLYGAMCMTAALGVHDALFFYLRPSPVAMHLGQFMPVVFMFVTGWLVLMQLVTALARQEALTAKLRRRVIERTRALRHTEDRLEKSERDMLLSEERERIMMDLHDGVGGHLVNALAALRQMPQADALLRDALEEAQTDLGLMVDSLYNPGDVAGLLAALRARLEPLLNRQGLRFDWRVDEEPLLPDPGPSANIDLLRIVQEFVTNTLKHSGAGCITVQTGARHLRLADDGRGFSGAPPRGHGLTSMRKRALRIGARFDLSASPAGTVLRLDW